MAGEALNHELKVILSTFTLMVELVMFITICIVVSRKTKMKFYKVAISVWTIVFLINCVAVIFDVFCVLGFNVEKRFDGGINGKYISLGYGISVEGHNLIEKSNYDIRFISLLDLFGIGQ